MLDPKFLEDSQPFIKLNAAYVHVKKNSSTPPGAYFLKLP